MVFSWFKDRRKELLAEPFPTVWDEWLAANVRHYAYLDPAGQVTVQAVVAVLAAEKHWTGGRGFEVTDEMKVTVAGQAAVMVLGLDEPYYFDRVQSIILYPDVYIHPPQFRQYGNAPTSTRLLGEAWYHSPIVLSWKHVLQSGQNRSNGGNVVVHEFAHHLDGLDGQVDGIPPLTGREREKLGIGSPRRNTAGSLAVRGGTKSRCSISTGRLTAPSSSPWPPSASSSNRTRCGNGTRTCTRFCSDFYRQDPAECWPDAAVSHSDEDQQAAEEIRAADETMLRCENADELFTFAVICLNEGRYALAEKAASRAIDLDPSDAEAYQYRAAARVGLGQYMPALNDCNRAIEIDDSDEEVYRARGAAYVGLQQYELAKADLDRVLREKVTDAEAYRLRGSAFLGMNQVRRALWDYSKSIASNPLSAETYLDRALAYRKLGRTDEANADLEKAFQLDPEAGRRQ